MSEDQLKINNLGFVNIYDEREAERWCNYFGISKLELNNAVMASGKSPMAIKRYLERIKSGKLEREKREERYLNGGE